MNDQPAILEEYKQFFYGVYDFDTVYSVSNQVMSVEEFTKMLEDLHYTNDKYVVIDQADNEQPRNLLGDIDEVLKRFNEGENVLVQDRSKENLYRKQFCKKVD